MLQRQLPKVLFVLTVWNVWVCKCCFLELSYKVGVSMNDNFKLALTILHTQHPHDHVQQQTTYTWYEQWAMFSTRWHCTQCSHKVHLETIYNFIGEFNVCNKQIGLQGTSNTKVTGRSLHCQVEYHVRDNFFCFLSSITKMDQYCIIFSMSRYTQCLLLTKTHNQIWWFFL